MKSVNKILILFLFIISLSFIGIWEVLQSEWVAQKVSNIATKYAKEVLKSDVQFEKLKFNLLPPAAEMKNVRINVEKNDIRADIELDLLGLYFDPFDIFNTQFTIDDVIVSDGRIKIIDQSKKTKKSSNKNKTDIEHIKFDFLQDVPVNKLTLKDIQIKYNNKEVQVRELKGINKRDKVNLIGKIQNVMLNDWVDNDTTLDEVSFDFSIADYDLKIKKVAIKTDLASLKASGDISAYLSKNIKYKLNLESNFPIEVLHDFLEFKKIGQLYSGHLVSESLITGQGLDYKVRSDLRLKEFQTDFIDGDLVEATIETNSQNIKFTDVSYVTNQQEFKLVKEFEFYNFGTKKFIEDPIVVDMKKLELKNVLKYLRSKFNMLSGEVTGQLNFNLYKNSFDFIVKEDVLLENLKLQAGNKLNIIELDKIYLSQSEYVIDRGIFKMNTNAHINETLLNLTAKISNNDFQLKMPTGFLDLKDLRNLLGYKIGGKGTLAFDIIKNDKSETVMGLKADLKDFNFMGYQVEQVKGRTKINFTNSLLEINKLIAANGKAKINGAGKVNLESKSVNIKYEIKRMDFSELKKIMKPVFGGLKISSNEIHGDWNMKGDILGFATPTGIKINADVYGVNNYFFDEGFDVVKGKFLLEDSKLKLKDLIGKKSKGSVKSYIEYGIKDNDLTYWMNIKNIALDDIFYFSKLPFSMRGKLGGSLEGSYINDKWAMKNEFRLTETKVGVVSYKDSFGKVNINDKNLKADIHLFGDEVYLNSQVFLGSENKSSLNLKLDIPKFRKFIGVFKGVDSENKTLVGNIKYELNTKFNYLKGKFTDIYSNINEFKVLRHPVDIDYSDNEAEVIVNDSLIQKWDINIRNRGNFIMSRGQGKLDEKYKISSKVKLHASLLELLNPIVTKADGEIRGIVEYEKDREVENVSALARSNNLSLTTKYLPTSVTNSKLELSFEQNELKINKFIAKLVNGEFELNGGINFSKVIPDINLRYKFKDAGITIMKKSALEFSGTGSLIGKTFPYTLGGDFYIQKFSFINELTDLSGDGKGITKSDIEYLPTNELSRNNQYINLNVNVLTREPIFITNSLADIGFVGNIHVLGGEKDIRLDGKISLAPRKNIISFKNNTFELTKGNVFFEERKKYSNPELDFSASSNINNHQVSVELLGPVQNFRLNLVSEPSLSQSDILSLIAFGYTEDLSSTLTDSEKESMTRAGVGSIIFDSFKINETLKSEFGLEVNLGTEISQTEGSYLERRNTDGETSEGKVSSSTKIELTKKVGDAMSLSVSSTVGNNSQQKQSVNLNYNLNKNISVEGVYESRTNDETETINDDTSFGTDVKWKWSFK